jgi:4-alpha-glucanotransferase
LSVSPSADDTPAAGELAQLAELCGIEPEFVDNDDSRRITSRSTTKALLTAMGWDVTSAATVSHCLREKLRESTRQLLAPVAVVRARPSRGLPVVFIVPHGFGGSRALCRFTVHHEDGGASRQEQRVSLPGDGESFTLMLKPELSTAIGCGYHRLLAELCQDEKTVQGEQQLIVHPGRCAMPLQPGERRFGLWANLYSLRSEHNWGFGDFADLARLTTFAGATGAAFTGINPLHALHNDVGSVSPYSPLSRRFLNPLYLSLEAMAEHPGHSASPVDSANQVDSANAGFRAALSHARQQTHLDYPALWSLKRPRLLLAYKAFVAQQAQTPNGQRDEFDRWCDGQGQALLTFATFMALSESQDHTNGRAHDWRQWPEDLQHPQSNGVATFREQHGRQIDFHCWLQFQCDQQLGAAARQARQSGQELGLYQDLAIGTPPSAADTWAHPELFVSGVRMGCPPDAFASEGQDWQLTPLCPRQLMNSGWRYWRGVLRTAMAHSGVLRIDHVMGLFRQFWIPNDASAKHGAYVRFPSDLLLGILALESRRHNTLIVGEDLGTVPKGLPTRLAQRKILSSRVALFERNSKGAFRSAATFSRRAMLTANTHDLPPLDALWSDDDLVMRRRLGQISDDEALAAAQRDRRALRKALLRRVGLTTAADKPGGRSALTREVYRWLSATPAPLLGVSLDDLCGETEPVNIPGMSEEQHPSWSRRMGVPLEDLAQLDGARELFAALSERGGRKLDAQSPTEKAPGQPGVNP